jgi:hypothetical protein
MTKESKLVKITEYDFDSAINEMLDDDNQALREIVEHQEELAKIYESKEAAKQYDNQKIIYYKTDKGVYFEVKEKKFKTGFR